MKMKPFGKETSSEIIGVVFSVRFIMSGGGGQIFAEKGPVTSVTSVESVRFTLEDFALVKALTPPL